MTTMPANPTPAEGVVVPIYPTEAMLDAAHGVPVMTFEGKPVYTTSREAEAIYLAMLAARPAAPTQSAAQTGEVERLKAALEECVSVLALAEHGKCEDPDHQEVVTALGQSIGFGALMSAAQYGWRETLRAKGYPLGGEFIAGPCYATVITALKQARQALSRPEPSQ